MRPTVGLSTLPQRLAGLTALRQTAAPQGSTAQAFAQTMSAASGADATTASGGSWSTAGGTGAAGWPAQGVPQLPPGVRFANGSSLIVPQLPGTGGAPGGPGHVCACHSSPGGATALADGVQQVAQQGHAHGAGEVDLDRVGPPAELQAYGNGQIPTAALEPLGVGEHRLWAPAARAYRDLAAHAAADGVTIGINSSYRDIAGQHRMVERYGLYSQGGRAAAPGTSNHGWGVALDLSLDDGAQAWMRENAERYGFVEDVPREPWHWTFKGTSY